MTTSASPRLRGRGLASATAEPWESVVEEIIVDIELENRGRTDMRRAVRVGSMRTPCGVRRSRAVADAGRGHVGGAGGCGASGFGLPTVSTSATRARADGQPLGILPVAGPLTVRICERRMPRRTALSYAEGAQAAGRTSS